MACGDSEDTAAATCAGDAALPLLTVAIQAGGESRRMGRSKATVPFLGRPLLARVVSRVAPIADEVLVSTNEPENLGFLQELPCACKVRLVRDVHDRRSSLGGLCTAFSLAKTEFVAVGACDMIFLAPELYRFELETLAADPSLAAAVPVLEEGFEPFHAVYRRELCLPHAEAALAAGRRSVRAFLDGVRVREVTPAEVDAVAPGGRCFLNTNTPEELAAAERLVREVEGWGTARSHMATSSDQ